MVDGGAGDDLIWASLGNDKIYGKSGDDTIGAGAGNDVVYAGSGEDRVWGGNGNDAIFGGVADDRIWGGSGRDILNSGNGDDTLYGGSGNDILAFEGGSVASQVGRGGSGADVFVMADGAEAKISDFEKAIDALDLRDWGIEDISDVKIESLGQTRVVISHEDNLLWVKTDDGTFDASDILYDEEPQPYDIDVSFF